MSELEWLDIFGDNLVSILQEYRLSQRELADMCGVSESVVSSMLRKKHMPSLKTIINMSHALSISIDELVYFDDKII